MVDANGMCAAASSGAEPTTAFAPTHGTKRQFQRTLTVSVGTNGLGYLVIAPNALMLKSNPAKINDYNVAFTTGAYTPTTISLPNGSGTLLTGINQEYLAKTFEGTLTVPLTSDRIQSSCTGLTIEVTVNQAPVETLDGEIGFVESHHGSFQGFNASDIKDLYPKSSWVKASLLGDSGSPKLVCTLPGIGKICQINQNSGHANFQRDNDFGYVMLMFAGVTPSTTFDIKVEWGGAFFGDGVVADQTLVTDSACMNRAKHFIRQVDDPNESVHFVSFQRILTAAKRAGDRDKVLDATSHEWSLAGALNSVPWKKAASFVSKLAMKAIPAML